MKNNNVKSANRVESDSLGNVEVPADKYWGAQTQRSLMNFSIGTEKMPEVLIESLAIVKVCAAKSNFELNLLDKEKTDLIVKVGEEIIKGSLKEHFPLSIWQTGSGTQTNMNVNEVISNRGIEIVNGVMGSKKPLHPNDDVNKSQSSNDVFPTAMNIATVLYTKRHLLPVLEAFLKELNNKATEYKDIIKIGRTHLQDATPLTLGQEFSGYVHQVEQAKNRIELALLELHYLAQGATAVGTGINAHKDFADTFAKHVTKFTGVPFKSAKNKFAAIASHDDLANFSSALSNLAIAVNKIANDIRLLSCGPRSGIMELTLPSNEPGSSIMPGKVNPTQIEAITMVCAHVIGQHHAVILGAMQGHLELNVYKPMIIHNILSSITLLADSIDSFNHKCLKDITANKERIAYLMSSSLMLVTSLNKHIGYDKAAEIAKLAFAENLSLKEAALKLKYVTESDFDKWVDPKTMI